MTNPASLQHGFVFHLIIVLKIIIASHTCDEIINDNPSQSFVLGDTACENNDRWATIVLVSLWSLLHVVLLLDIKLPSIVTNRVRRPRSSLYDELDAPSWCIPSIADPRLRDSLFTNTIQVRVPYKKLVEDYAKEFFSKPVLCTMGEGIDELANRSIRNDDQMQ